MLSTKQIIAAVKQKIKERKSIFILYEATNMSVVIVGGHDRMHCRYKEICKKYGCKCKVFTQCPASFKSQIGNPDVVIVFTGTVAHKMVNIATEQAQKTGAVIKHCHSSSACALNGALCEFFSKA